MKEIIDGKLVIRTEKTYPPCKGRVEKREGCEDIMTHDGKYFCDTYDGEYTYGCPYLKGGE